MRKLATIRKIDDIAPIVGADAIEVATVGGWKVVIKRDEYKVGDLAIYCEIDSWIPYQLAPFLSKGTQPREYNGVQGERLRTIRLRGQISQGLLLPLKHLTNYGADLGEGSDVTSDLNIQKYEPPIPAQLAGEVRGMFPSIIPKTDQERVQNLTQELNEYNNLEFEVTEKLDGSSCTFYLDSNNDLHVCSRNLDMKYDENNTFWKMAIKYDIKQKMIDNGLTNFAIQGELIGEGIQGNKYKIKGQDFYVFDVYSANEGIYVNAKSRLDITKTLNLNHVPVISYSSYINISAFELLTLAEGKSILNKETEREGLVFKSIIKPEIHFKAISNKFLIKTDD